MSLRLPSSLPSPIYHHHLPRCHRLIFASNSTTTTTTTTPLPSMEPTPPSSPPPTTSWWRWRRALGQRLNAAGVLWFANVASKDPHLALPHVSVPDIRHVDWDALARSGFRGVVFDKDNTLTAPYSLSIWPPIVESLDRCRAAFPGRIAILSNSAGLYEYDPDELHAKAVEEAIEGVHVIRHGKDQRHVGIELSTKIQFV